MVARSVRKPDSRAPAQSRSRDSTNHLWEVREAGVDWLTCTANTTRGRELIEALGQRLIAQESSEGCDVLPWSFEQFTGLNAGQVALGVCPDMSLLRLSGWLARHHWTTAYRSASNVSRLDYQVTIEGVTDGPSFIRDCHQEALTHAAKMAQPPEVLIRDSNRTGPTLYLGTRKSAWLARVYDKAVESRLKDYDGCIRAEVQFQKRAARSAALALSSTDNVDLAGLSMLSELLQRRGLRQLWPHNASITFCSPRMRSNDEKRLRWLKTQVAPAVAHLVSRRGLHSVLSALDLNHLLELDQMVQPQLKTKEEK